MFSPNTEAERRRRICNTLEVEEVTEPGKYLGVLMKVGKNKSGVFKFLQDMVGQKLQAWTNKCISKTVKLVLLKTASQSIPNFWMSLFLLPVEISGAIQR